MTALRLAFMGSSPFALPALEALRGSRHEIAAVYTRPPRPAGRGRETRPTPVHVRAVALGLEVRTPVSLKDAREQAAFRALDLDCATVAAYGPLLPRAVLEAPRLGCLNLHPSLLPRWRGAAPVARAILTGDERTGATVMAMDGGFDTGPILAQRPMPIPPRATTPILEAALADLAAALLIGALEDPGAALAAARPQGEEGTTYAPKLDREDGRMDWSRPAETLDRLVRAFSPWPGAFFPLGGTEAKVLEAQSVDGRGAPGRLLDREMTVACGEGALRLARVQRAGRIATDGAAFQRGLRLEPGAVLT